MRDEHSEHTSSVSHQVFNFAGQSTADESQFRYDPAQSSPDPSDMPQSDEDMPDIDHPHMRGSMDSERGVPFMTSPLGSGTNLAGGASFP